MIKVTKATTVGRVHLIGVAVVASGGGARSEHCKWAAVLLGWSNADVRTVLWNNILLLKTSKIFIKKTIFNMLLITSSIKNV